jgi:hypothetical protein
MSRRTLDIVFDFSFIPPSNLNSDRAKAVADGAIMWFVKQAVVARATRFAFGAKIMPLYDQHNHEHQGRRTVRTPIGEHVTDAWSEIVPKVSLPLSFPLLSSRVCISGSRTGAK